MHVSDMAHLKPPFFFISPFGSFLTYGSFPSFIFPPLFFVLHRHSHTLSLPLSYSLTLLCLSPSTLPAIVHAAFLSATSTTAESLPFAFSLCISLCICDFSLSIISSPSPPQFNLSNSKGLLFCPPNYPPLQW